MQNLLFWAFLLLGSSVHGLGKQSPIERAELKMARGRNSGASDMYLRLCKKEDGEKRPKCCEITIGTTEPGEDYSRLTDCQHIITMGADDKTLTVNVKSRSPREQYLPLHVIVSTQRGEKFKATWNSTELFNGRKGTGPTPMSFEDLGFLNGNDCGFSVPVLRDDPKYNLSIAIKHPWMGALVNRNENGTFEMKCSVTLITSKYVLTAAHCVEYGDIKTDFKVYLNESDYPNEEKEEGRIVRNLKKANYHPRYILKRKPLYYDLAVLELDQEVEINDKTFPICLPTEKHAGEIRTNRAATIFSYGTQDKSEVYTNIKSTAFMTQDICEQRFNVPGSNKVQRFHESAIPTGLNNGLTCTDARSTRQGICRGDGGSPVFIQDNDNDRYVQLGIVLGTIPWVHQRCSHEYPGVHIRLSDPIVSDFIKVYAIEEKHKEICFITIMRVEFH